MDCALDLEFQGGEFLAIGNGNGMCNQVLEMGHGAELVSDVTPKSKEFCLVLCTLNRSFART